MKTKSGLHAILMASTVFAAANLQCDAQAQTPASSAAPAEVIRLRGTVESMQDGVMTLKERGGKTLRVNVPDKTGVQEMLPIEFDRIRAGAVVGSTGLRDADGSFTAIEVRLFPGSGGPPEGQRSSDLQRDSILSNGHVKSIANKPKQRQLTLTIQNQEVLIRVPDVAPVMTYGPADLGMLKPGVKVYLHVTQVGPDQYKAASITVGANGMAPPQ